MRVLTYPNPFEIQQNKELWGIITRHPHFCASDTLVQGLEAEYDRTSFGILRTVETLVKEVLGSYTDDPKNDIQTFLNVSSAIREIKDNNMRTAFRFNIADVVKSVQLLILLGCDPSRFAGELTGEQRILLDIYKKVVEKGAADTLDIIKQINKADFIIAARKTINAEIEYLINSNEDFKSLEINLPLNTTNAGYVAICKIISHLKGSLSNPASDQFSGHSVNLQLKRVEHLQKIITETDDSVFDRIIIHGVHRMTPQLFFLVRLLDGLGIEVIFLINYAKNLPNVYKTWREVYKWCDTKFEHEAVLDLTQGNELGTFIANIIEGNVQTGQTRGEVIAFDNLTAFTDNEVRTKFKSALKKCKQNENALNKMDTQYYAVHGESSNEILRMYFPEQFQQKPFLSYPIGQFILGIYQMWNFECNTLVLNEKSLSECAVSSLYKASGNSSIFEIIHKLKLYFSDIESIDDYFRRIEELATALEIISRNNKYDALKKLSFFSVTLSELDSFRSFLRFLEDIAVKLFKNEKPTVDYGKHFKSLMEILSVPAAAGSDALTVTEQELIKDIADKLLACKAGEVIGHIEDLRDALFFYLSGSKKKDTSNWIVRDFEQIDGAVLLRKQTKAQHYHFALLSNTNMTGKNDDTISWPLTEDMFTGYADIESAIPVITTGLLERRNFLKFSLFYGAFFTKCNIKLSYVKEEKGEDQTMYYLFKALGYKEVPYKESKRVPFRLEEEQTSNDDLSFDPARLTPEAKELFSICPFKFLQREVIKAPIEYTSEYHVKYFVANFMYSIIRSKLDGPLETQVRLIDYEFADAKKLFPFWDRVVFLDIEKSTRRQLSEGSVHKSLYYQLRHEKRKENFLIAQWKDYTTGQKNMVFDRPNMAALITQYLNSEQLYPNRSELPHTKVCENCNFAEVCLRNYYDAHGHSEGGDIA